MINSNQIRSKVFTLANTLHYQQGLTKSEALTKAWKVIKLKEAMKSDQVNFTYQKKDGTTRQATGTTSNQYFTYQRKTDRPQSLTLVTYYDLEKKNFRSFQASNILQVA